jgi:hypothetical protein
MANGTSAAAATLVMAMERLVGVRRLTEELVRRPETLVLVTVGGTQAHLQRAFVLQVLDAEDKALVELLQRLLGPPAKVPEVT